MLLQLSASLAFLFPPGWGGGGGSNKLLYSPDKPRLVKIKYKVPYVSKNIEINTMFLFFIFYCFICHVRVYNYDSGFGYLLFLK